MKLLTVGDSFTYGEELSNRDYAWPNLLASKLGYELTNLAEPARGNTFITRKVIKNCKNVDLVVVAWSHWARTEFSDDIGTYDIWPGCNLQAHNHQPWRKKLIKYYSQYNNDDYLLNQFLINVILLQSYLESQNKKYIMMTTFGQLMPFISRLDLELFLQVKTTNYIDWPYQSMMEWTYGVEQGPGGHFLEDGHQIVADKIYEHIRHLGWIS